MAIFTLHVGMNGYLPNSIYEYDTVEELNDGIAFLATQYDDLILHNQNIDCNGLASGYAYTIGVFENTSEYLTLAYHPKREKTLIWIKEGKHLFLFHVNEYEERLFDDTFENVTHGYLSFYAGVMRYLEYLRNILSGKIGVNPFDHDMDYEDFYECCAFWHDEFKHVLDVLEDTYEN